AMSSVTGRTLPASGYMSRPGSGPAAVFGRVTQQRATPSSVFTSILVAAVDSVIAVLTMQRGGPVVHARRAEVALDTVTRGYRGNLGCGNPRRKALANVTRISNDRRPAR